MAFRPRSIFTCSVTVCGVFVLPDTRTSLGGCGGPPKDCPRHTSHQDSELCGQRETQDFTLLRRLLKDSLLSVCMQRLLFVSLAPREMLWDQDWSELSALEKNLPWPAILMCTLHIVLDDLMPFAARPQRKMKRSSKAFRNHAMAAHLIKSSVTIHSLNHKYA